MAKAGPGDPTLQPSSPGPFDMLMALSIVEGLTGGSSGFKEFLDSPPESIPDQIRDQNDGKRHYSKVL
ncbi:MAG TPA: hypothetical protein VJ373_06685 [Desulfatiglandales bacterium]|nr:hypothetical protein [Desulfatiglandales bacterium]